MDFEFTSTGDISVQILNMWNVRLLESIPRQCSNLVPNAEKKLKGRSMTSRSFRSLKHTSKREPEAMRRADSFSKLMTHRTKGGLSPIRNSAMVTRTSQGTLRIGGLPPLPNEVDARTTWGNHDSQFGTGKGSQSQELCAAGRAGGGSPPPLPPRISKKSSSKSNYDEEDDPDYAYIKEDEIKGPSKPLVRKVQTSGSVDDILNELERDIMRDNQAKKIEEEDKKRRTKTLGRQHQRPRPLTQIHDRTPRSLRLGPRVVFTAAEPQDYMDFVPTKGRTQTKSSSSEPERLAPVDMHVRSASEPEPLESKPNTFSQPQDCKNNDLLRSVEPVTTKDPTPLSQHSLPIPPSSNQKLEKDIGGSAPSLPPRTWRNTSSSNLEDSQETPCSTSETENLTSLSSDMIDGGNEGKNHTPQLAGGEDDSNHTLQLAEEKLETYEEDVPLSIPVLVSETQTPHIAQLTPPCTTSPTFIAPGLSTPPPLPPRSPTKDNLCRKSSSSSISSYSSTHCPHCRGSRKHKLVVEKTVSLGASHGNNQPSDDCRKSLPDLAGTNTSTAENGLGAGRHRYSQRSRHCSKCDTNSSTDVFHGEADNASSSSLHSCNGTTFEYLQLVGEEQGREDVVEDSPTSAKQSKLEKTEPQNSSKTMGGECVTTTKAGVRSKVINNTSIKTDLKLSLESEASRGKRKTPAALLKLNHSLPQTVNESVAFRREKGFPPHYTSKSFDSMSSSTSNGHTTRHNRASSCRTHTTSESLPQRSTGLTTPPSLHSAPPMVPPRSMVSLMQQPPMTTPINKLFSKSSSSQLISSNPHMYGTKPTFTGNSALHHSPARVSSAGTINSNKSSTRTRHPFLARRQTDHMENHGTGQSSTVFIHHLKNRREDALTHLV